MNNVIILFEVFKTFWSFYLAILSYFFIRKEDKSDVYGISEVCVQWLEQVA